MHNRDNFRFGLGLCLVGIVLGGVTACSEAPPSSSGGGEGGNAEGGNAQVSSSSASGSTSSSSTGGAGGAGGSMMMPDQTAGPDEMPYFKTPEELCTYVNDSRQTSQAHDRWRGLPFQGEYHMMKTWPIKFTVDPTLNAAAQAEADALAAGAAPQGSPHSDGMIGGNLLHQYLYVDGVETANYMISSQQLKGDWIVGSYKAGLINANGTARMALYYHDSGGIAFGPKLSRMGCGGKFNPVDKSTWWVVKLAP